MRSALVVRHRVNLVDDDSLDASKRFSAAGRGQQDVQRFRRRHENVRRSPQHRLACRDQRVAGADRGPDFGHRLRQVVSELENFRQRPVQVLLDVVTKRLERRDVQNLCLVLKIAGEGFSDQRVDTGEKRRQRLARSGRRGNQRAAAREDLRPAESLRFSRCFEFADEPFANDRMGPAERVRRRRRQHRRAGGHPSFVTQYFR